MEKTSLAKNRTRHFEYCIKVLLVFMVQYIFLKKPASCWTNDDLIFKQFFKITHGLQTFILNGLNLAIKPALKLAKKILNHQLMQRGNLAGVVLFVWAVPAGCSTSAAPALQIHFIQLISCLSNVGSAGQTLFFNPFFLNWAPQTQCEQLVMKGQGSPGCCWARLTTALHWELFTPHKVQLKCLWRTQSNSLQKHYFTQTFLTTAFPFPNNIHLLCTGYAIWSQIDPWRAAINNLLFAAPNIQLLEWEGWDRSTL